jgi:hypothetical protein
MGIETGVDVYKITDVAEDLVVPMMDHPIRIDRDSLTLGYAGVYSSFLLFAKRAEKKYGVPAATSWSNWAARHGRRPGRHDRRHGHDHGARTRRGPHHETR